jgi:cephalosporin hydroxylase
MNHATSINDPFYFPDPVEEAQLDYEYFGCGMQQNRYALPALSILLEYSRPARIIELGTRHGGLSIFLGIYAKNAGITVHTFDIEDQVRHKDFFEFLKIHFHQMDIFAPEARQWITRLIESPQRTLLLCDALKIKEFNLYARHLKTGDIILAHDFAMDQQDFERMRRQRIWWTCEIMYPQIADTCRGHNLEPLFADMFRTAAWGCFIKNRPA